MQNNKIAQNLCIGCGLCHSEINVSFEKKETGFLKIKEPLTEDQEVFIDRVCPVLGKNGADNHITDIWGKRKAIYQGFATDTEVRRKASSGGMITALGMYLLSSRKVDGVIHISRDENTVYGTKTIISTTYKEIIKSLGSRYSISSPWYDLKHLVESDKKYLAIGKPCDIAALKSAQTNLGLYPNIIYLISFFCAGMPSDRANRTLLRELKCTEDNCRSLDYRGNGWPGYAVAVDSEGHEHQMEYSNSWGGILGRDVHNFCRICNDGIGLNADISCGDGWYIKDNKPDFSEHDGRNIVIARNDKGEKLLQEAQDAGYINVSPWDDVSELKVIQYYQYTRRATMRAKLMAYRLFGKTTPEYDRKTVNELSKLIPFKKRVHIFLGTVKRAVKGRI